MTAEIRPLAADDAAAYHALRLRALREHPAAFAQAYEEQLAMPLAEVADRLQAAWEAPDDFALGLFVGGALSGMVGFRRERRENARHKGHIWGVYVAAEAQGQGLGKRMMQEAISRAARMDGLEQINLAVVSGNPAARSLYISLGFVSYGLECRAVFVNGEYLDDEYMTLFLNG